MYIDIDLDRIYIGVAVLLAGVVGALIGYARGYMHGTEDGERHGRVLEACDRLSRRLDGKSEVDQ